MTTITVCKHADDDYIVRVHGGDLFNYVVTELKDIIPTSAATWSE